MSLIFKLIYKDYSIVLFMENLRSTRHCRLLVYYLVKIALRKGVKLWNKSVKHLDGFTYKIQNVIRKLLKKSPYDHILYLSRGQTNKAKVIEYHFVVEIKISCLITVQLQIYLLQMIC